MLAVLGVVLVVVRILVLMVLVEYRGGNRENGKVIALQSERNDLNK